MTVGHQVDQRCDAAAQRVLERCDLIAACSEESGRVTRTFLCPAMRAVHDLVGQWMSAAGMSVRVDAAGNIVGRRPGPRDGRVLLFGSHLDSVPNAGKYDGVLGVLLALEAVAGIEPDVLPFHVDVVGFSEEEGVRFAQPYLGCAAIAGEFDAAWLDRCDGAGVTLRESIAAFGLDPAAIPAANYEPEEVLGYVEAHIEQGPVLERAEQSLGIVSGIAGQTRMRLCFTGKADHAGTTPMELRRDALVPAAQLIAETNRIAVATPGLRATVGFVQVDPNVGNVVPARVELSLDVRHLDDAVRAEAVATLEQFAFEASRVARVGMAVTFRHSHAATRLDPDLRAQLAIAARQSGFNPLELPSGAGHDAVVLAKRFPAAMLFLRHPGGVSHHPDERVDAADVAASIAVLRQFILNLAAAHTP